MIRGVVNTRLEATIRLRLRGPGGGEIDEEAIIDTGSTAALTVPASTPASLGLLRTSTGWAAMADGSISSFGIFEAELEWDGVWQSVLVSALGSEFLVGMPLLTDHELRIEVVPGGEVEITPLP